MKKLVIIFILPFFLGSCMLDNIKYLSNKFTDNNKKISLESAKDINNSLQNDTSSWITDEEESETWSVEKSETWSVDDGSKVLSIEEQYCKSKWWKVGDSICYVTDDIWLLKCNVNVFYLDMCRDKSAKIEDWVVVSIPSMAKKNKINSISESIKKDENKLLEKNLSDVIVDTKKVENIDKKIENISKEDVTKYIVEKKLWNWFIFKEDDNNKYLFLNSKLITKLSKSSKIMMNSSDDEKVISFNIYSNKSDSSPSKTLYIDMESESLTEKNIDKTSTQTGDIASTTKTESDTTSMTNSKSWKSWTYFISGWDLKIKTVDWDIKTIFSAQGSSNIYDYDLMVNKQIKVYYNSWSQKEEKIINLP